MRYWVGMGGLRKREGKKNKKAPEANIGTLDLSIHVEFFFCCVLFILQYRRTVILDMMGRFFVRGGSANVQC